MCRSFAARCHATMQQCRGCRMPCYNPRVYTHQQARYSREMVGVSQQSPPRSTCFRACASERVDRGRLTPQCTYIVPIAVPEQSSAATYKNQSQDSEPNNSVTYIQPVTIPETEQLEYIRGTSSNTLGRTSQYIHGTSSKPRS